MAQRSSSNRPRPHYVPTTSSTTSPSGGLFGFLSGYFGGGTTGSPPVGSPPVTSPETVVETRQHTKPVKSTPVEKVRARRKIKKPLKKQRNPNASIMWPSHATSTYRDPTASTRSQVRKTEKALKEYDYEQAPVVGAYVGMHKEVSDLHSGAKQPDMLTMLRMFRTGISLTPARFYPGSDIARQYASKIVAGIQAKKAVNIAKEHQ